MRAPKNNEIDRRGFRTGDAPEFVTRTAAIGSTPAGAQNPLWSAQQHNGIWCFCKCPCCALMRLTSGQGEDVVEVRACVLPASVLEKSTVAGDYAREGDTNKFVQTLPQWEYGPRDTRHFAPGDTVEFTEPKKAEFSFASITIFNLNVVRPSIGGVCPMTVTATKLR